MEINKKISQFVEVNGFDETTIIPIVQGTPPFNAYITGEKLVESFVGSGSGEVIPLINRLDSSSLVDGLTANMGRLLNEKKLEIDGVNSSIKTLTFNTNPDTTTPLLEGEARWNTDDNTLDIGMRNGVIQQVGMEQLLTVRNATSTLIPNGTALMGCGIGDKRISVCPMLATESTPGWTFAGIATEDIQPNSIGVITTFGYVRDVDMRGQNGETWQIGDQLYISTLNAGQMTNVFNTELKEVIQVGTVMDNTINGQMIISKVFHLRNDFQNSLEVDGTGRKYPSVDAVNVELNKKVDSIVGKSLIDNSEIERLSIVVNQIVPTKISDLQNDEGFITSADISNLGGGDMLKVVYDTNSNGIVDNSEKVGGSTKEQIISDARSGKVDSVFGKSLISDNEITRLSTVTNQDISGKQDKLTAGDNIVINGNVISSTGGGGGGVNTNASTLGGSTKEQIINDARSGKQDTLTAGPNITISGNVISASGGGGGTSSGDMLKSVYDTNSNGIVDNAEKVNGFTVEKSVPSNAVFTDTPTDISGKVDKNGTDRLIKETEIVTFNGKVDKKGTDRLITLDEVSTFNGKQNSIGFTPENSANKNVANGYLGLDGSAQINPTLIISAWKNFNLVVHNGGALFNIDFNQGNLHKLILNQDANLNNPTIPNGATGTFVVIIEQDAYGLRDLTYSNKWRFPNDIRPSFSTQEANKINIISGMIVDGLLFVNSIENFSKL